MRIYNITPYNLQIKNNNRKLKQENHNYTAAANYAQLPSTAQYLAFTGGYSLDLGKIHQFTRRILENGQECCWKKGIKLKIH